MKKFFSLMVAVASMFAFAACTPSTEEPTDNPGNGNGNGGGEKTALATPTLEVKDVTSTGFTVVWEAVENAEKYMVNNGEGNVTITETSYKMENLNAGTYTVKVMAMPAQGANYSNSEFATVSQAVTGLTPEECDWFACALSLPTEEMAEQYGLYPFYHIISAYIGTDVIDVRTMAFDFETYGNTPVADLVKECVSIDAEYLAEVNSEEGIALVTTVNPETKYRVITIGVHQSGLEVIYDQTISTTVVVPHPAMEGFLGTWSVKTPQVLVIPAAENDPIRVEEEENTVEVTIYPALQYGFDCVAIVGLSKADPEGSAAWGYVDTDDDGNAILGIMNWEIIGQTTEGYYIIWNTWGEVASTTANGYYLVSGGYPTYIVNKTTGKSALYEGKLQDGGTFKALTMDIYAYTPEGALAGWFYKDEGDIRINAGAQDWTFVKELEQEPAEPATFSKSLRNNLQVKEASLSSLVAM